MRGVTETVAWFGESSHMVAYKADIFNIYLLRSFTTKQGKNHASN